MHIFHNYDTHAAYAARIRFYFNSPNSNTQTNNLLTSPASGNPFPQPCVSAAVASPILWLWHTNDLQALQRHILVGACTSQWAKTRLKWDTFNWHHMDVGEKLVSVGRMSLTHYLWMTCRSSHKTTDNLSTVNIYFYSVGKNMIQQNRSKTNALQICQVTQLYHSGEKSSTCTLQ